MFVIDSVIDVDECDVMTRVEKLTPLKTNFERLLKSSSLEICMRIATMLCVSFCVTGNANRTADLMLAHAATQSLQTKLNCSTTTTTMTSTENALKHLRLSLAALHYAMMNRAMLDSNETQLFAWLIDMSVVVDKIRFQNINNNKLKH